MTGTSFSILIFTFPKKIVVETPLCVELLFVYFYFNLVLKSNEIKNKIAGKSEHNQTCNNIKTHFRQKQAFLCLVFIKSLIKLKN